MPKLRVIQNKPTKTLNGGKPACIYKGVPLKKKDPRVKHEDDNDIFDRPMTKKIGSPL